MIDLPLHTNAEITKRVRFGLAAIIVLATALRGFYLHAPLSGDELTMVSLWAQMPFGQIPRNYQYPNNHIFLALIESALLKVFGVREWILRLPVMFCGLVSVYLGYLTALRISRNAAVGLAAALLLAVSGSHIYYSTNIRGYLPILLAAQITVHALLIQFNGFRPAKEPASLSGMLIFGLALVWLAASWTIPTFMFFEGMVSLYFGALLLKNLGKKATTPMKPYIQMGVLFLIGTLGLFLQYFVLINRSMLNVGLSRAAVSPPEEFLHGVLSIWTIPPPEAVITGMFSIWEESFLPLDEGLVFAAILGLVYLWRFSPGEFRFFLMQFTAPLLVLFAGVVGWIPNLPHYRVFVYLQPFFLILAAQGGYVAVDQVGKWWTLRRGRPEQRSQRTLLLFNAVLLVFSVAAIWDIVERIYPERAQREPFHKLRQFVNTLQPLDLLLASNRTHVGLCLYVADAVRERIDNITRAGEIGNLYLMEHRTSSGTDLPRIRRPDGEYLRLEDYELLFSETGSPVELALPAALLEEVARIGPFVIHKVVPRFLHRVYALKKEADLARWSVFGNAALNLDPDVKRQDGPPVIIFDKPLVMTSRDTVPADPGRFSLDLHLALAGPGVNLVFLNGKPGQSGLVPRNGWRAHAWTLDHSYGPGILKQHWRPMIFLFESSDSIEMVQAIKGLGRTHGLLRGLQTYRLTWPLEKSSSNGVLREQE